MAKKKLKSYHFDCGNSSDGPVGFCARIQSTSKKKALEILREAMPESIDVSPMEHHDDVEYIQIYTGTENVRISDINDWEEVEAPPPDDSPLGQMHSVLMDMAVWIREGTPPTRGQISNAIQVFENLLDHTPKEE